MDVIRPIYPDIPTRFEIKIRPGPTLSLYSTYPPNFDTPFYSQYASIIVSWD